jgi:hypothetical protein
MRITTALSLAALIALSAASSALAATPPGHDMSTTTYAVIGDTPYSVFQIRHFTQDVAEINVDSNVTRVIHLGDIKSGSTRCDTVDSNPDTGDFTQIKAAFDTFADPLVYTPGDNEWTDCHRANNGGYQPAGDTWTDPGLTALLGTGTVGQPSRLSQIRSMFFPALGQTLGANPATVDAQSEDYPENVTWEKSRVQFGMLNVPGSNNDWAPWFGVTDRSQTQIDEVTDRTDADLEWLDHIFSQAKASKAKAVLIGIQADMWDPAFFSGGSDAARAASDHFTPIVNRLAELALEWERPVLLMNGDSHVYEVDNPFSNPDSAQNQIYGLEKAVPNIARITVNGSTTPCHQWLKLTINPKSDSVFSWERKPFANQDTAHNQGC